MCLGCCDLGGVGMKLRPVWGGVMSVCIVNLDSLCRWQIQVSVYRARWIPAHLRCTHCSIMLHLIYIGLLTVYLSMGDIVNP